MIIDSHAHITDLNGKFWGVEDMLSSMDKAGIDISFAIAGEFINQPTEKLLQLIQGNERIKVIGDITYGKITETYLNNRFAQMQKRQIIGLKFYPGYQDFYPQEKSLFPIYSYCENENVPIIFHMGLLEVGYEGNNDQIHPKHIRELAARFSKLKIVIAHLGYPWLSETAQVITKYTNVYTDISGFFTEYQKIADEEKEEFITKMKDFKRISKNYNKCLFGTDWPLYDQLDYLETVKLLELDEEEKDLLFWKNAKNIFNL